MFLYSKITFGQATNLTHAGANPATDYLGWDAGTGIPLQIRTDNVTIPYSIEFWTNGATQMVIDGNTGNVGIGNAVTTNPPYKLTVEKDINIKNEVYINHSKDSLLSKKAFLYPLFSLLKC